MAQSDVHTDTDVAQELSLSRTMPLGERRLRRISAWLLLIFLLMGELGAVWDREWHAYVGRDQFWTPPHTLIYSCVAGAGLTALIMVLLESYRYYHRVPGVDNDSTIAIFRFFHAPLGFSVLGFGALIALIAAPLDNYWHELYGIDIALWAPFHMMGVTGGLIGMLGMVYVFASEAAIQRATAPYSHPDPTLISLEIGIVMTLASILNYVLTGFLQFPLITIGTLHISSYPLPLVAGISLGLVAVSRTLRKPGIATLLILLLLLHTLVVELFVPWAIRTSVTQQGIPYRIPGIIPFFSINYAFFPVTFLLSALVIDTLFYWQARHPKQEKQATFLLWTMLYGAIVAIPTLIIAPLILSTYTQYAPIFLPEQGITLPANQMLVIKLLSYLVVIAFGFIGVWLGEEFGTIWRWNKR